MRILLLSVVACGALGWSARAQGQANAADAIVTAAREALGGTQRIASITSFITTGRTRQVQGDNLVPIEFELACEWPDKCYRRDEIPARESGPTTIGFNGDALIQLPLPSIPAGPDGRPGTPAQTVEAQRAARANTAKQDFARLMLGIFVKTIPGFPVTFTAAGEAEAPQGKADILDVAGPSGFAARLFVFRETRLPIMLTWQAPAAPAGEDAPEGFRSGRPGRAERLPLLLYLVDLRRQAPGHPLVRRSWRTGCTSPTTATWTASGSPSACVARSARRRLRKPRSIDSG